MHIPWADHRLQGRDNTILPNLEKVAIARDGLKELHGDSFVRVSRDPGLDQRIQHFSMLRERVARVVGLLPFLFGNIHRRDAEGATTLGTG